MAGCLKGPVAVREILKARVSSHGRFQLDLTSRNRSILRLSMSASESILSHEGLATTTMCQMQTRALQQPKMVFLFDHLIGKSQDFRAPSKSGSWKMSVGLVVCVPQTEKFTFKPIKIFPPLTE
jgi:hypothetical protein